MGKADGWAWLREAGEPQLESCTRKEFGVAEDTRTQARAVEYEWPEFEFSFPNARRGIIK